MGSETCRIHLENLQRHLTVFEIKPKKLEGNLIFEWFNVGENIFEDFYHLGTSVKWNSSEIKKNQSAVNQIVSTISKNQGWLQTFITIYPGLRIDFYGATPAVKVCRVRSGIEFLLRGFTGISSNFDKVINDLEQLGELEEFDDHLKVWKNSYRPDFFSGDKNSVTPNSHWWWF